MQADLFLANFLKGRLEPTILYMGREKCVCVGGGGGFQFGELKQATDAPHSGPTLE